jgi:hypothetical protein
MTGVTKPAKPVTKGVGTTYRCWCPDGDSHEVHVTTVF